MPGILYIFYFRQSVFGCMTHHCDIKHYADLHSYTEEMLSYYIHFVINNVNNHICLVFYFKMFNILEHYLFVGGFRLDANAYDKV